MSSTPFVDRLRAMGAAVDAGADEWESGEMAMLVGVYAGLTLGTFATDRAGQLRRQIETELAGVLGVPPEVLEAQFRELINGAGS